MTTIDLHGVKHADVEKIIENFLLLNDMPVRIITGNSSIMKSLVKVVLERHDFKCQYESDWNLGSLIITD